MDARDPLCPEVRASPADASTGLRAKPQFVWGGRIDGDRLRRAFDNAALSLTIGAEEELILVDAASDRLAARVGDVLATIGFDDRFHPEFRASQIEIVTRPCLTPADVGRELAVARIDLAEALRERGRLVACGTHPTCRGVGPMTEGERYEAIAADNPWAALHMLTCGLHIHVALADADRALAVYNALRSYLPEFAALAANSPFHQAGDSGTSSVRLHLNRSLCRAGVPPAFENWKAYSEFVAWGGADGSIPDPGYHWWDLRLHPGHGTLELRACDAQTDIADAVALVGLAQTLVAWLAGRFDRGEALGVHDSYRISESLWMAARTGARGSVLDLDSGERLPVARRIAGLLEELAPMAAELGTERELARVSLLSRSCGAEQQRERVNRYGLDGLVDWIAERTLSSAWAYLARAGVTMDVASAEVGERSRVASTGGLPGAAFRAQREMFP